LSWVASTSQNIKGYNLYRADVAGGSYVKRNGSPVSGTIYLDSVTTGRTYYYVATAVNTNNIESSYSVNTVAVVP
jgi:hypothetical protein